MILAGFGGQGMMLLGKLVAKTAMDVGKEVTFFPSYGAEVRGGTAHCQVIYSDEPIFSPIVEVADTVIVMNQASYKKFRPRLKPNGRLFTNSSMTQPEDAIEQASPATLLPLPATETANELGNVRVANMLMLGAYASVLRLLPEDAILNVIEESLSGRKAHLLEVNRRAFRKGAELAAQLV